MDKPSSPDPNSGGSKQAAEELGKSEAWYRALVTATSDVIYRMNADWSMMQELDGGSFLSETGEPMSNWMEKYIHPMDQDKVQRAVNEAISYEKIFELEHRVLQANGETGWTSSKAVPIRDDDGKIIEWFGSARDITRRKKIEEDFQLALDVVEQQKRLYEAVTSNTPDLVYVFGLDYRFTYANQALLNMWGKTWDEAIGKRLLDNGYEPWHAEMHEREIDRIVADKKPIRGEVAFPHATQGRRVYDYILVPIINEKGEVEAIGGTTRDISDIKEDELRKNEFISMVSHELKTPLTSTTSYVQVTQKRALTHDDPVAADMLGRASVQLAKMTRMINGFLNVSRLESGKVPLEIKRFDLGVLVREVQEETAAEIFTHRVVFDTVENIWLEADRDKIGQVFSNLLSNAAKYSPIGSTISVFCTCDDDYVTLCVSDEGVGISKENLPQLFDRYYRVKALETQHVSGFGIGLYLCSEIIKRHNGEIWAESEAGKGSKFCFRLPCFPA